MTLGPATAWLNPSTRVKVGEQGCAHRDSGALQQDPLMSGRNVEQGAHLLSGPTFDVARFS